jgi:hypothetical protein
MPGSIEYFGLSSEYLFEIRAQLYGSVGKLLVLPTNVIPALKLGQFEQPSLFQLSVTKKKSIVTLPPGTPSNGFFDSTPKSTGSTPLSSISGQRFFGPDFNPENFNVGRDENGETSPFCGERSASKSGPSNLRQTLDHRRQLVMLLFQDQGLFPSNQV